MRVIAALGLVVLLVAGACAGGGERPEFVQVPGLGATRVASDVHATQFTPTADDGVRLGHSHVGDAVDDALARIAEPVVRALGTGHDDRIRICANDTCQWLFYDESRTGQRRWCNMATCGNRAKARRHRERLKAAEPVQPD